MTVLLKAMLGTGLVLIASLTLTKAAALGDLLYDKGSYLLPAGEIHNPDNFTDDDDASLINFDAEQEIDDFMRVETFVSPRELQNPLVNHHKYTYTINNINKCNGNVFVLALVKTVPENFVERQDIRETWGSVKSYKGQHVQTLFILGNVKQTNKSNSIRDELIKENAKYGDVIQGDFIDHYKNQSYKSIMGLSWASEFCKNAKFTLVTTDTTMVDIYHVIDFLTTKTKETNSDNLLYCSTFYDLGPVRDPNDQQYINIRDYPYKVFPPHCEGFAYLLSDKVQKKLLEATKFVPFLWLDDVYVTGLLAAKADLKHTDMSDDHTYNWMQDEHLNTDLNKNMFLLAPYKELRKNWNNAWRAITKNRKYIQN